MHVGLRLKDRLYQLHDFCSQRDSLYRGAMGDLRCGSREAQA